MIRTQIQLSERQADRLRDIATRRHVSIALVIREAVDRYLSEDPREARIRRALAAAGIGSGPGDASVEHDRYFAEAAAEAGTEE